MADKNRSDQAKLKIALQNLEAERNLRREYQRQLERARADAAQAERRFKGLEKDRHRHEQQEESEVLEFIMVEEEEDSGRSRRSRELRRSRSRSRSPYQEKSSSRVRSRYRDASDHHRPRFGEPPSHRQYWSGYSEPRTFRYRHHSLHEHSRSPLHHTLSRTYATRDSNGRIEQRYYPYKPPPPYISDPEYRIVRYEKVAQAYEIHRTPRLSTEEAAVKPYPYTHPNISPADIGRRLNPGLVLTQGIVPQPCPLNAPTGPRRPVLADSLSLKKALWSVPSKTPEIAVESPVHLSRKIDLLGAEVNKAQKELDAALKAKKELLKRKEANKERETRAWREQQQDDPYGEAEEGLGEMARNGPLGSFGERWNKAYQEHDKMPVEEDQVINQEYQVEEVSSGAVEEKGAVGEKLLAMEESSSQEKKQIPAKTSQSQPMNGVETQADICGVMPFTESPQMMFRNPPSKSFCYRSRTGPSNRLFTGNTFPLPPVIIAEQRQPPAPLTHGQTIAQLGPRVTAMLAKDSIADLQSNLRIVDSNIYSIRADFELHTKGYGMQVLDPRYRKDLGILAVRLQERKEAMDANLVRLRALRELVVKELERKIGLEMDADGL